VKVYLIIIACIQGLAIPLEKSCIIEPMKDQVFKSVSECLIFVDYFKANVEAGSPDLYVTGFCTTKEFNSI